jgi:hypothetical protein
MTTIFPFTRRKLRRIHSPSAVTPEDLAAHQLRVLAEQAERDQIEAGRRERLAQRHARREAHEAALDEVERLASLAFPWERLQSRRALVEAFVRISRDSRPLTAIAVPWASFCVFGAEPEAVPPDIDRRVINLLRATCPYPSGLDAVAPMLEFVVRRTLYFAPEFDVEDFQRRAWAAAERELDKRLATVAALLDEGKATVDLGRGRWGFHRIGDEPIVVGPETWFRMTGKAIELPRGLQAFAQRSPPSKYGN